MLGFNPYAALGGVLAFIAAVSGAFFEGKHVEAGEQAQTKLQQLTNALNDRDQKQKQIDALETAAAAKEQQRQTIIREVTREIPTIIRDPVYSTVCVSDPGVRALDRAAAAANGDSPGPVAGGSGPTPAVAPHDGPGDGQAQHQR
jgi:hypothetical protein